MDERNNDFDFNFPPIGQAVKKARETKGITAFWHHWLRSQTHSDGGKRDG